MFKFILIFVVAITSISFAQEALNEEITFSFGDHNSPPYAYITNGQLDSGLIKDFGDEIAKRLNLKPKYRYLSRNRVFEYLKKGTIDVVPLVNPVWTKDSSAYFWSISILEDRDAFLSKKDTSSLKKIEDLKGMRIGTNLGYYYKQLDTLFKVGYLYRDDARAISHNLDKLRLGRVDATINSELLLKMAVKNSSLRDSIKIEHPVKITHELKMAITKNHRFQVSIKEFNGVIQQLIEEGFFEARVQKYLN